MAVALSVVVASGVAVILAEPLMALTGRLVAVAATLVALAVRLVAVAVFGVASGGGAAKVADACLPTIDPLKHADWSSAPASIHISPPNPLCSPPPIHIFQQNPVWVISGIG